MRLRTAIPVRGPPRKGEAPGTAAALAAAREQLVVCGAPGCVWLVNLQAARRCARAAGVGWTKVALRRYWTDPPWRCQSHQTLQRLQRLRDRKIRYTYY